MKFVARQVRLAHMSYPMTLSPANSVIVSRLFIGRIINFSAKAIYIRAYTINIPNVARVISLIRARLPHTCLPALSGRSTLLQ